MRECKAIKFMNVTVNNIQLKYAEILKFNNDDLSPLSFLIGASYKKDRLAYIHEHERIIGISHGKVIKDVGGSHGFSGNGYFSKKS